MKRGAVWIILATVGVLTIAVLVAVGTSSKTRSSVAKSTNGQDHHEMNSTSNMNDQPDQDIGSIVDLTSQSEVTMDIKDFKYSQPNIKIKSGTKVTWTNQDSVKHNVMRYHEDSGAAHDAPAKSEVKPSIFAGQLLAKGESYSFTFSEVGANPYHCSPHPYMKGNVTVVE